jgi:hypothetical protein
MVHAGLRRSTWLKKHRPVNSRLQHLLEAQRNGVMAHVARSKAIAVEDMLLSEQCVILAEASQVTWSIEEW